MSKIDETNYQPPIGKAYHSMAEVHVRYHTTDHLFKEAPIVSRFRCWRTVFRTYIKPTRTWVFYVTVMGNRILVMKHLDAGNNVYWVSVNIQKESVVRGAKER